MSSRAHTQTRSLVLQSTEQIFFFFSFIPFPAELGLGKTEAPSAPDSFSSQSPSKLVAGVQQGASTHCRPTADQPRSGIFPSSATWTIRPTLTSTVLHPRRLAPSYLHQDPGKPLPLQVLPAQQQGTSLPTQGSYEELRRNPSLLLLLRPSVLRFSASPHHLLCSQSHLTPARAGWEAFYTLLLPFPCLCRTCGQGHKFRKNCRDIRYFGLHKTELGIYPLGPSPVLGHLQLPSRWEFKNK